MLLLAQVVCGMGLIAPVAAQDGWLDLEWGAGGRALVANDLNSGLQAFSNVDLNVLPDGKLLLTGGCPMGVNGTFCAAQVHAGGMPDLGFGPDGLGHVRMDDIPQGAVMFASARAADGSILLAGRHSNGEGGSARIARLTPAGLPDPGVGAGNGYLDFRFRRPDGVFAEFSAIVAMAILPDGKVLVAGIADSGTNNIDFAVARLFADLSSDPGFGVGGSRLIGFDLGNDNFEVVRAIAVQSDGKIVLAGHTGDIHAVVHGAALAARLDVDGALDTGFATGGKMQFTNGGSDLFFTAVAVDGQGRIVLAGSIVAAAGRDLLVTRTSAQGAHDLNFGVNGNRIIPVSLESDRDDVANALVLQSDGKILLAGQTRRDDFIWNWVAARVLPSGHLDTGFGSGGTMRGTFVPAASLGYDDVASGIAIGNGGLMIAGTGIEQVGTDSYRRFGLAKLTLDLVFTDGFQPDDPAIVAVNGVNLDMPVSPVGTSIQWHTGATCQSCDQPPFDFTVWGPTLRMFWPFVSAGGHRGGVAEGGVYSVLAPGATIGPSSEFSLEETDASTANWRQAPGVDGYLGFRFQNPTTGEVNYGYAHIVTTDPTGFPAALLGFAYNRLGEPITIP